MESIPGCHFYSNNRRNRITIEYFDLREEVLLGKSQVQYVFSRFHEIQIPTMKSGQAWLPLHYVKVRTVKYGTVCWSNLNKIPIFYFPSGAQWGQTRRPPRDRCFVFLQYYPNLMPASICQPWQPLLLFRGWHAFFFVFAVRNV